MMQRSAGYNFLRLGKLQQVRRLFAITRTIRLDPGGWVLACT